MFPGLPIACGPDVAGLLELLNLPQEFMGIINIGKSIVCGGF